MRRIKDGSARARSSSTSEPSIPSALEDTIISSYRAQRLQQKANGGSGQGERSPASSHASFRTAISQSQSRSHSGPSGALGSSPSREHAQAATGEGAWPALPQRDHHHANTNSRAQQQQHRPIGHEQTVLSLSPPSPSTTARSPSPLPTPAERHLSRHGPQPQHEPQQQRQQERPLLGEGPASRGRASPSAEAHSLLAKLQSRTATIVDRQRQHRLEEPRALASSFPGLSESHQASQGNPTAAESAVPSVLRSASSSVSRPLQRLTRPSSSRETQRGEDGAGEDVSPLTVSEEEDDVLQASPRQLRAERKKGSIRAESRSSSRADSTSTHEEGPRGIADRESSDAGREEDRYAWQQRLIDAQLRLRERQEQQPQQQQHPQTAAHAPSQETEASASAPQQLSRHLQLVEQEWARKNAEFQAAKNELEAELTSKFIALREAEHQRVLSDARGSGSDADEGAGRGESKRWQAFLREHFSAAYDKLLAKEAAFQNELETRVMEQVAVFTQAYKQALDKDFEERCQRLDSRVAERDRRWVAILAEERKRLHGEKEAEGQSDEQGRRQQAIVLGAVGEAMQEVSALRDELTRDHERQQAKLMQVFLEKRDALNKSHAEALARQAQQVARIQKDCAASVMACQAEVDKLHAELAERNVDIQRLTNALAREQEASRSQSAAGNTNNSTNDSDAEAAADPLSAFSTRCARIREEVSRHWRELFNEQHDEHRTMLRVLSAEYDSRVEALRAEQQKRLAELSASHQHQLAEVKRITEEQWAARLEDHRQQTLAQVEQMKTWEGDNADLRKELQRLRRERDELREEYEAQAAHVTAQVEATWRAKMEAMRERYEQLLEAAVTRHRQSVPQEEHTRVQEELQAAKLKLVDMAAAMGTQTNAQIAQAEREWREKLERQAEQHREAVVALRHDYEGKLSAWRESLAAKEADWHAQSQESIARLQMHMQQQVEQERASCEAVVAAAHSAVERRVAAFAEEAECHWRQRQAAADAQRQEREARLAQQEDRLRLREANAAADQQAALAQQLSAQREELYAQLEKDRAALAEEKEAVKERGRQLTFQLQRTFDEKLAKAKQQLRGQQRAMCAQVFTLAEAREQVLLAARAEEVALLTQHYRASLTSLTARQYDFGAAMREEMAEMFDREAATIEVQKNALVRHMRELQQQISRDGEAACRELLQVQLEELRKQNAAHAEDGHAQWQSMQEYVLQRTRQLDEERRSFETNLRKHYEELLQAEKQRTIAAIEDLRATHARDLDEVRRECEAEADKRADALRDKHEADQQRWLTRLDELTDKFEGKLRRHAEKLDEVNRDHHDQLQSMRDALAKEYNERAAAQEATLQVQQETLRRTCDARVQQSVDKERALRAQFACDLVAVEKRHLAKNEALQQELHRHFDEQLATLRRELQSKEEQLVAMEAAREAAVRAQVEAAVAEMQQRYEAFAEAQQQEAAARLNALAAAQQEREEAMSALQYQSGEKLHHLLTSLEAQAKADAEERARAFREQTDNLQQVLHQERTEKAALQREREQLRHTVERLSRERGERESLSLPCSNAALVRVSPHTGSSVDVLHEAASPGTGGIHGTAVEQRALPSASPSSSPSSAMPIFPAVTQHFITVSPTAPSVAAAAATPRALAPRSVNIMSSSAVPMKSKTPLAHSDMTAAAAGQNSNAPNLSAFLAGESAWHRLCELWAVLEVTAEERAHFKERLMVAWAHPPLQSGQGSAGESRAQAVRQVLQREAARREEQLPLLEAFARRQALLECSQRPHGTGEGEGEGEGQVARQEVAHLTEQLKTAIPQHEKHFGQTLLFRGQRLMEQVC